MLSRRGPSHKQFRTKAHLYWIYWNLPKFPRSFWCLRRFGRTFWSFQCQTSWSYWPSTDGIGNPLFLEKIRQRSGKMHRERRTSHSLWNSALEDIERKRTEIICPWMWGKLWCVQCPSSCRWNKGVLCARCPIPTQAMDAIPSEAFPILGEKGYNGDHKQSTFFANSYLRWKR